MKRAAVYIGGKLGSLRLERSAKSAFIRTRPLFKSILDFIGNYRALRNRFPSHPLLARLQLRLIRNAKIKGRKSRLISPLTDMSAYNSRQTQPLDTTSQLLSRRQRFYNFAKSTRDSYIPKISEQVSLIANGVSNRAFGTTNMDLYDTRGNLLLPESTKITLFPSYTRVIDNKYHVDVNGWLWCPGLMTRKNRLILSFVRLFIRANSDPATTASAIEKLNSDSAKLNDVSDTESIVSATPSRSSQHTIQENDSEHAYTQGNQEERLKQRMECFIARSIPFVDLRIDIGLVCPVDPSRLVSTLLKTDPNGHFSTTIICDYEPSAIQVQSVADETIFAIIDAFIIPDGGIGLISDIDDTIKQTGVVGDKRELLRTLLLKDISGWGIPAVSKWYIELLDRFKPNISFHYVSNSPWQLYSTIKEYFDLSLIPPGSFHLKQYTGNIIASLMEPSASRKKRALYKIVHDFPHKRFVCVGDSGEHDLEAYVDLAKTYPHQVLVIYIRYVTDSLLDYDDKRILKKLGHILDLAYEKEPVLRDIDNSHANEEVKDLIDLSDLDPTPAPKRKAPPVPQKPLSLQSNRDRKPPLPKRPTLSSSTLLAPRPLNTDFGANTGRVPTPPPRRTTTSPSQEVESVDSILDSEWYFQLEETDRTGASWIRRIVTCVDELKETKTQIRIFVDQDDDLLDLSVKAIGSIDELKK